MAVEEYLLGLNPLRSLPLPFFTLPCPAGSIKALINPRANQLRDRDSTGLCLFSDRSFPIISDISDV